MTTLWRTVLQARSGFRLELHAVHDDRESRVVYDKDGPLAVLLPCLEDGTVDHSAVDEHNGGVVSRTGTTSASGFHPRGATFEPCIIAKWLEK